MLTLVVLYADQAETSALSQAQAGRLDCGADQAETEVQRDSLTFVVVL